MSGDSHEIPMHFTTVSEEDQAEIGGWGGVKRGGLQQAGSRAWRSVKQCLPMDERGPLVMINPVAEA